VIQYGEPYEKMHGIARLSDKKLNKLSGWTFLSGLAFLVIGLATVWFSYATGITLVVIAVACLMFVIYASEGARFRRSATWRPLTAPITISDVKRTRAAWDSSPEEATTRYDLKLVETAGDRHEVVGDCDGSIKIGDQLMGDIWPYSGELRNLKVVPAQA